MAASPSTGLSSGAVAGIVMGVVAALCIVGAFGGYHIYKLEKERKLRRPLPIPEEFGPTASQMRYVCHRVVKLLKPVC